MTTRRLAAFLVIASAAGLTQAAILNVGPLETYTTIQSAVNAASAGDTINVAAGTYNENIIVGVGMNYLQLLGAGSDSTTISIASGNAIYTNAPIIVKGFHITGPGRGTGDGIEIRDTGSGGGTDADGTAANPGLVEDCKFTNLNYGVQLHDHRVQYWEIKSNQFDLLRIGVGLQNSSHFLIQGNRFNDYKEGISAGWDDETADNIEIKLNWFFGSHHDGGDELAAIVLSSSTHDYDIYGNYITDSIVGILVKNKDGINTEDLTNVSVSCNNIEGNSAGAVNEDDVTLLAESNWWDDVNGPSGVGPGAGDSVTAYVDYDPWLGARCPNAVPEPATLAVLALGGIAILVRKKRRVA